MFSVPLSGKGSPVGSTSSPPATCSGSCRDGAGRRTRAQPVADLRPLCSPVSPDAARTRRAAPRTPTASAPSSVAVAHAPRVNRPAAHPPEAGPRVKARRAGDSRMRFRRKWTRTQRIRTAAAIPVEAVIVDQAEVPVYLRIATKAAQLRELGMSDKAIARQLSVSDKTVAKAIRAT